MNEGFASQIYLNRNGQTQGPCLSDKYHLQLPVGLLIATNLAHSTILIRQHCCKVHLVTIIIFICKSLVAMGFHWKIVCLCTIPTSSVLIRSVIADSGDRFLMRLVQSRQFSSMCKGSVQQFSFEAIREQRREMLR
jgi:hypothetical protein